MVLQVGGGRQEHVAEERVRGRPPRGRLEGGRAQVQRADALHRRARVRQHILNVIAYA